MNRLSTFLPSSFRLTKTCYPTTAFFRRYSFDEKNVKRKYPVGISDFKEIKEENYFFWDRTRFVKDFYEDPGKSVLILRPRRWAKSTTVSMVKYFFNKDVEDSEFAKRLFAGTKIEEEKEFVSRTQGQFPVISISFSGCRAKNWERMEGLLRGVISGAYEDHNYLQDGHFLDDSERKKFQKIREEDPTAKYESALKTLTRLLHRYHGKRVIVLVDEYDVPVNEAHIYRYYDSALPFLTATFTNTLKDNLYLEKGLLTGVLRIAKSGYLSGLNNLRVYSLLDERYATVYGVQQQELNQALEYEGLTNKKKDVKRYYNGYSTAIPSILLYNPWSVLNYLYDQELKPYWIETGKIDFVANAMWSSPVDVKESLLPLLDRKTLTLPFDIDINYKALDDSPRALWSLLYFSGYLTGKKKNVKNLKARIPNTEVKQELSRVWERVIEEKGLSVQYSKLISALLSGNQSICETNLRTLARTLFSVHDLARTTENWYHGFMLAVLYPLNTQGYKIQSNAEAGLGRVDIALRAPVGKPDVIIELKTITDEKGKKTVENDDDLRSYADEGLQQIIEKDYIKIFDGSKTTILWSIAFVKKFVAVSMKNQSGGLSLKTSALKASVEGKAQAGKEDKVDKSAESTTSAL